MTTELGDKARLILKGMRAGTRFTFSGKTSPQVVNQLLRGGYIERVAEADPYWVVGLYRITRKGSREGQRKP